MCPSGTEVQTKWGRAVVQEVYTGDKEMALTWPDGDEPEAQYRVDTESVWLQEDRPDDIKPSNKSNVVSAQDEVKSLYCRT